MFWYPLHNHDRNVTFPSPIACKLEFDICNAALVHETKQINTICIRSKYTKNLQFKDIVLLMWRLAETPPSPTQPKWRLEQHSDPNTFWLPMLLDGHWVPFDTHPLIAEIVSGFCAWYIWHHLLCLLTLVGNSGNARSGLHFFKFWPHQALLNIKIYHLVQIEFWFWLIYGCPMGFTDFWPFCHTLLTSNLVPYLKSSKFSGRTSRVFRVYANFIFPSI